MSSKSTTEKSDDLLETESNENSLNSKVNPVGKYVGDRNISLERHGKGWAILPNGDQYEGDYRHGQRHGYGLYVFKNGARYLGQYRCGLKSGKGIFIYPDGSIYDGEWRKDLKHGYGIYYYENGDMYKGNWYKNKRHGLGSYIYKQNEVIIDGTWRNGKRIGPVEIQYKNFKYHGNWNIKYPNGPGMYTFNHKYMNDGYYTTDFENLQKSNTKKPTNEKDNLKKNEKIDFENNEEFEDDISKDSSNVDDNEKSPKWISKNYFNYDFSKLPQQPIPQPLSDSEESVCELSVKDEETDRKHIPVTSKEYFDHHEDENEKFEGEDEQSLSKKSSGNDDISYKFSDIESDTCLIQK